MKYFVYLLVILSILGATMTAIFAHPGGTARDGCHYCRTDCDKWGEAKNRRHCH